jgi:hypothetical protein
MAKSTKGVSVNLTSSVPKNTNVIIKSLAPTSDGRGFMMVLTNPTSPIVVGDVIKFGQVGYPNLNGKSFVACESKVVGGDDSIRIGNVVLGSGTLTVGATVETYATADDVCICVNSFGITKDTPGSISTATFCDPSASIPSSTTTAGSVSFGGYVEVDQPDYPALLDAEADGLPRLMKVSFPAGQGFIIFPVIISSITWDIPLDGAIGYTGAGTLASKAVHNF